MLIDLALHVEESARTLSALKCCAASGSMGVSRCGLGTRRRAGARHGLSGEVEANVCFSTELGRKQQIRNTTRQATEV